MTEHDPDDKQQDLSVPILDMSEPPAGSDRRAFMMRSALAVAIAALTGRPVASIAAAPAKAPPLDPKLAVVKSSRGP
jgi:L-serine dehydratase